MQEANATEPNGQMTTGSIRTTNGGIALRNLHAHLESLERQAVRGTLPTESRVDFIDLLALRGHFLGRIADAERSAQLAGVLHDEGLMAEADVWRARAGARYDELAEHHPEAFADPAVEFWRTIGGDPDKAVALAMLRLEAPSIKRSQELLTPEMRAADRVVTTSEHQPDDRPFVGAER